MRILVCGGRDFQDYRLLEHTLGGIHSDQEITHIVTGAQRSEGSRDWKYHGADWMAIEWALEREINFSGIPAKWGKYGKSAGPRRNREMLKMFQDIQLVVAFRGGKGTADMVAAARQAGIPVKEIAGE